MPRKSMAWSERDLSSLPYHDQFITAHRRQMPEEGTVNKLK